MKLLQKIKIVLLVFFLLSLVLFSCQSKQKQQASHVNIEMAYTCPMPEDSFFSDKPGKCPKCGMDLVKVENHQHAETEPEQYTCPMPEDSFFSDKPGKCPKCVMVLVKVENNGDAEAGPAQYTCPMHPQIIKDKPGDCPICGMKLVKKEDPHAGALKDVQLESLLKPTNQFVVSKITVTTVQQKTEQLQVKALGIVAYNTESVGTVSARVAGRIEKLYVRYKYQLVSKGQKMMDIYSPELLTAQQNLLFLLQHDAANNAMIDAAKQKLLLLGMSNEQLQQVITNQKVAYTVSVYSNYSGHVHEAGNEDMATQASGLMKTASLNTEELSIKEGMYIQKGQNVFSVYNPGKAWALLNIYANDQGLVQKGAAVTVTPEAAPDKIFKGSIGFIEPFYRSNSKTLTARVNFDNSSLHIPIGSQVNANIETHITNAYWLPVDAVVSLGVDKVVFRKEDGGFRAHKIVTGISNNGYIQVISGLTSTDEVAANAQYLMDSESFIKVND